LISAVSLGDPENSRIYINSAEVITNIKIPAARTNPEKLAVIIAVVMVKVNGVNG